MPRWFDHQDFAGKWLGCFYRLRARYAMPNPRRASAWWRGLQRALEETLAAWEAGGQFSSADVSRLRLRYQLSAAQAWVLLEAFRRTATRLWARMDLARAAARLQASLQAPPRKTR